VFIAPRQRPCNRKNLGLIRGFFNETTRFYPLSTGVTRFRGVTDERTYL